MEEASNGNAGRQPPSLRLPPYPPPPSLPVWPWPALPGALPPNASMWSGWPAGGGFPHPSTVYGPPSQAAPFFHHRPTPQQTTYTFRPMLLHGQPPSQQLLEHARPHSPWTPLQKVVERIESSPANREQNELSGYNLKERMRLATMKLEQLTQIMQELQQLRRAAASYTEVEAAASSSQNLQDLPQSTAPPQPTALHNSELAEQVQEAQAAASAIRASLLDLLEPLKRLEKGDATESEKAAWQDYQARQKRIRQYRTRRKRKQRQVAEKVRESREAFARLDAAADQWRAQHLALDIARNRMGQMAKAAHELLQEKQRQLERHAEALVLLERLQELRALRIAKLRKQGHVFPEEDAAFMASVQASAQQEAEQAAASEKGPLLEAEEGRLDLALAEVQQALKASEAQEDGEEESKRASEAEVEQYYLGPTTDISKLIQVRRAWDSFLSPLGSAIPGHWVEPPKPSSTLWAQFLTPPHD